MSRMSVVRNCAYAFVALIFADIAYGDWQDGKPWQKPALAALLWILAILVHIYRKRRRDIDSIHA